MEVSNGVHQSFGYRLFPKYLLLCSEIQHSQAVTQLKELARIMKHLVPLESEITQEIIRYNVDPNLAKYEDGDDIVKWWAHVMSLGKYPALSQVIRRALSIFHGPLVESSFSLMGDVIDAKRSSMKISTFDAVQTVKYVLRSRGKTGISMFKRADIDKTLCQNIRVAGRRDKTDREKRMEAKQKRQVEYGCSATCESAEKAKTTALAEERQTRLKHVDKKINAARRKALDTLQEVARKKRKLE
ncbi:uncharacterized protein LOC128021632 [Carassius gibelio]|nr:uncharacterized protein LOC128021632 [Carassius gibelio]XP_052464898.1 uncharacterized protein LOC128021632 [Carassius gibelio]XP_052464899.1 uncharacterized protein LOC128021632 [Carassius gibelio]XP_052464900.1 uncharacterized protein LOC128021632 [Carassius gibelio]XP_052464901.1 uncharacterized protein LOC128021632 [Carassius gibelio]